MVLFGKSKNNRLMSGYADENPFARERKYLGETIKRIRESKKLTQEELANRAHADVSYIAKIENGYVNTTVRYLIKIARAMGIKVKDLFEF